MNARDEWLPAAITQHLAWVDKAIAEHTAWADAFLDSGSSCDQGVIRGGISAGQAARRGTDDPPNRRDVQRLLEGVRAVVASLGDYLERHLDALDEEMVDAGVPLTPAAVERRRRRVAAHLAAALPGHLVVRDIDELGNTQGVRQARGPHEAARDNAGARSAKAETQRQPREGETPVFFGSHMALSGRAGPA